MITAEQLMAIRNNPAKMDELANSPFDPHAIMATGGLESIGLPGLNLEQGGVAPVTPPGPMPGLGGASVAAPAPNVWGALSAMQGAFGAPGAVPQARAPAVHAARPAPIPKYLPHVGAPQTQDLSAILAGFKR